MRLSGQGSGWQILETRWGNTSYDGLTTWWEVARRTWSGYPEVDNRGFTEHWRTLSGIDRTSVADKRTSKVAIRRPDPIPGGIRVCVVVENLQRNDWDMPVMKVSEDIVSVSWFVNDWLKRRIANKIRSYLNDSPIHIDDPFITVAHVDVDQQSLILLKSFSI